MYFQIKDQLLKSQQREIFRKMIAFIFKLNGQIVLISLISILISLHAIAQSNPLNLGVERFGLSVEEPFHTAWDMYQDSFGRLVAYTDEHKNSTLTFDGKTFKKEKILQPHESILMRNDNGGYWKISSAFVATYVKNGKEVSLDVRQFLERNICQLYIYEGHHYLLVNDGYIKFDMIDDKIEVLEHHKYPVTRINSAYFKGDTIFISQNGKAAFILQSNPDEIIYTNDANVADGVVFNLSNDRIILKTYRGDTIIHKDSPIYQYLDGVGRYVNAPFVDSKGRLWSNQRANNALGLYVLLPNEDIHIKIETGIEKTSLLRFFEDNLGDIWVMSSTQGIVHLYDQSIRFINKSTCTTTDNISAIYQSKQSGNIYVSMNYQGIDILNSDGTEKIGQIRGAGSQQSILVDRKDRMWVISGGVLRIENNQIIKHYKKKDGFHSGTVTAIFEDSNGDIWAGTRQVLHKYEDDRFVKHQIPGLDVYDRIVGIAELSNTNLLLAIDNGLYFVFDGQKFNQLPVDHMLPNSLFTDIEGTIWLGTENHGLFYHSNGAFIPAGFNEYLQVPIRNLQDSGNGLLFGLCTDNKIFYASKIELKNGDNPKSIKWLTINGGLPLMDDERRRQPSTALLSTGEVVFPNLYGAIVINPEKILGEKNPFDLTISYNGDIANNEEIEMIYGDNDLTLDISNIYLNPQANYANQYRIDDDAWIDIPSNSEFEIRDLPSGINEIEVRAKHINGQWLQPIQFSVNVPSLFYERWWFIIGLPFLLGLMIYLYTKAKMKAVQNQNQKLEVLVGEQTHQLIEEKQQLAESLNKQKELTKELNLSQASKNRMYAQISHEFKSPLQAIKSYLSKNEGYIKGKDQDRIKGNIDNLLGISNEIMELSKAESGNLKVKKNWYNINGIINDQIELKSQLADERNITINHASKNNKQYLEIDISLIQKVINNLLSNAIKFSPEGGQIIIQSKIENQKHIVSVSDQGPGIPANEIENLTLAYYQASNNTEDGTGIGLSLVKEILKLHGSKLDIQSKLGVGSTFGFALDRPKLSQQEIAANNINKTDLEGQLSKIINPNKQIILAVDDSQDVLYFLEQSLSSKYTVITTSNGEEALAALKQISPIAIISDFNMPIMNGMELLRKVRQIPKHQALPFLFLTGSSSEETELLSMKAGADIILQKPIQEDLLTAQVSQLLNRQQTISDSLKSSFAHDLLPGNIHNDDLQLMKELESIFLENIDNGNLKSLEIAKMIGAGEKTLRNRVKGITGLTIIKYFRNFRLEKAKLLLDEGYGTMGEVAAATGFSSLSYFSKSYKAYFSKSASQKQ